MTEKIPAGVVRGDDGKLRCKQPNDSAEYKDKDVERLLKNKRIIRNRQKIESSRYAPIRSG